VVNMCMHAFVLSDLAIVTGGNSPPNDMM